MSFAIERGESYGLVGESGCGKTTVAMTLMRYLPRNAVVDGGVVRLDGEDLLGAAPSRLQEIRGNRIAMVYQQTATSLNPTIQVGEQIAEVYRHHRGMDRRAGAHAAREMLARVYVSDPDRVARSYPHELSGGQKQRVVIAMALATDPSVLILDEPTTGLDATVEAEVLDLIAGLRKEFNSSLLFISHNLSIVAQMCTRVGVMYAGKLVEEGPADQVLAAPQHPYTVALLRCVPRAGMRKDTIRLEPIPGTLPPPGTEMPACVFAERCPLVSDQCRLDPPPLVSVDGRHRSWCHHADEVSSITATAAVTQAPRRQGGDRLLVVEHLRKSYSARGREVEAVSDVSLEVRSGEILGVVGESGSGKTTLARCLVGLVDASAGQVRFDEVRVGVKHRRRDRTLRRAVQMVFQDPETALNPRRSLQALLRRSVELLGGQRGSSRHERVQELIRAVRLEPHHLTVKPPALSGGQKQRAAIAAALAGSPKLVVCDEPTSALDVSVQAAILNLLADLHAEHQLSYVVISHDLGVIRYLADRIAVMYLGEIVEVGPTESVTSPPHHPYTEALMSAVPTLDADGVRRERIRLTGTLPSPSNPPDGCRFHTRCPRALGDLCRLEPPPWQQDGDGHSYRCHIPPPDLRALQLPAGEGLVTRES